MKHRLTALLAGLSILLLPAATSRACTTCLVTRGATVDGSTFVSHSDDDELSDQRLIYVPALDHPEGAMRPVYCDAVAQGPVPKYNAVLQPRYVGKARGPGYDEPDRAQSIPLGYIPQVPHTYAYFDGNYGIVNEHQLMFGECTCGAKVMPGPDPEKRIFYSAELSRVALERCTKAREAVELMGKLIDQYGYYGTGETLLVADPEEGWVFEMCGYDENAGGGLWVAKKVPDGEVFAAANEFRIRDVDPEDPDMLFSANLHEVAQKKGWWDPSQGKLDWLRAVSNGEYCHPYYSLRRVWSIFRRLSPSSEFQPWVEDGFTREYPFSVRPDQKLDVKDVMALHRDHYEGTEFDMTQGMASGPFGTPNRYIGEYDGLQNNLSAPGFKMTGAWERPVSVIYCGYVFVNQGRSWLPDPIGGVCWFGCDKPSETVFVPFHVGVTDLPRSYQTGSTETFSRDMAWWAFNFVANWADLKYGHMSEDIRKLQGELEGKELDLQPAVDAAARVLHEKDPALAREYLTDYCTDNANRVVAAWWDLADRLIVKYDDGYLNSPQAMGGTVGYPEWWRAKVGYAQGPTTYEKPSPDR